MARAWPGNGTCVRCMRAAIGAGTSKCEQTHVLRAQRSATRNQAPPSGRIDPRQHRRMTQGFGGERAKRLKHALVVHAREGGRKSFATHMERGEAMERRVAEQPLHESRTAAGESARRGLS